MLPENPTPYTYSVVVPVYNSERILPELLSRLAQVLPTFGSIHEVIFVNDGKGHNILVFASARQEEGLGFVMIEAMLAGCAVLTTGSGGAMEIAKLADLPIFPKGDHLALSRLLTQFITNRGELYQIASRGQSVAVREFGFDRMMDRFETTLLRLYGAKAARTPWDLDSRRCHDTTASLA